MKKVLFVDDDQEARDFVTMSAKVFSTEFAVDTAVSSDDAIEKLNSSRYNAVIIDISLPDLQGTVLAQLIHEAFPSMPMAFLTAYDSNIASNMAVEFPMDYWQKTEKMSDFNEMKTCIEKLIRNISCDGTKRLGDSTIIGTGKITLPEKIKELIK